MGFALKRGLSAKVGCPPLLLTFAAMVHLNLPSGEVITPVKQVHSQFRSLMPFSMLSRVDFKVL